VVTSLAPRKSAGFESLALHQLLKGKVMKIDFMPILEKVERVIKSCKTEDQLDVAKNFMKVAFDYMETYLHGQYDDYEKIKFENRVTNLILSKYEELEWS